MKISRRTSNTLFVALVIVLIAVNLYVIAGVKINKQIVEYDIPILEQTIPYTTIDSVSDTSVIVPDDSAQISILYYSTYSDNSLESLLFLHNLSISMFADDLSIFTYSNASIRNTIQQIWPQEMHLLKIQPSKFWKNYGWNIKRPGTLIVTHQDTVKYEGPLRSQYLMLQIQSILKTNPSDSVDMLSVGDVVIGQIFNDNRSMHLTEMEDTYILVAFASFCSTCGNSRSYYNYLSNIGIPTYAIIPCGEESLLVDEIIDRETSIELYKLRLDSTNIPLEQVLNESPFVVLIRDHQVQYLSTGQESISSIISSIRSCLFP